MQPDSPAGLARDGEPVRVEPPVIDPLRSQDGVTGPCLQLGGTWRAAAGDDRLRRGFPSPGFDDSAWQPVAVPGHWQDEPGLATCPGPVFYRRRFSCRGTAGATRAWLVLEGIFYQSDVWLDGSYLGDTEGYFFPHAFDVTSVLARGDDHVLAIEVAAPTPRSPAARVGLTGVFGGWENMAPDFNPGGIWGPVHLDVTGPVRIGSLRAVCAKADRARAVLDIEAELDSRAALTVALSTELSSREGRLEASLEQAQPLAEGTNRVRWQLEVPEPRLWWPVGLGAQELYELSFTVSLGGTESDRRSLRTGLRSVTARDFVWRVNGERLFLKGANLAPTRRDIARATPEEVAADVQRAASAGLNLLRVQAHVGRPELYDSADQAGVLIWQDLPLRGRYRGSRAEAVRQAVAAVNLLGHHPSVAVWCAHDHPFTVRGEGGRAEVGAPPSPGRTTEPGRQSDGELAASDLGAGELGARDLGAGGLSARGRGDRDRDQGGKGIWRWLAAQTLPNRDKTVLDRSLRRALQRADPSRPALAHAGLLPHPAWGSAPSLYFGWDHGRGSDLARLARAWPAAIRFVGELGAQSVPASAVFMAPELWPDLDWAHLEGSHCLQKSIFDERLPPEQYLTFEAWREATQAYQSGLVKMQVEILRRLKYRPTGGFAVSVLNDAQQAISASLLGQDRLPKPAWAALAAACADVLVTAGPIEAGYRPGDQVVLDVHVVNDRRGPLPDAELMARARWPGGGRQWHFAGVVPGDSCVWVGRLEAELPAPAAAGALEICLQLSWEGGSSTNRYHSAVNPPS